ncbi:MAG TPA: hypothetical protein VJ438_04485 [Candidatus Nanoarchaeia archaeon]|nr:hypothetical protein [Candidatus Nanoarchaeia archaeon]
MKKEQSNPNLSKDIEYRITNGLGYAPIEHQGGLHAHLQEMNNVSRTNQSDVFTQRYITKALKELSIRVLRIKKAYDIIHLVSRNIIPIDSKTFIIPVHVLNELDRI